MSGCGACSAGADPARRPSYDLRVTEAAWLGGDPERQTHVILRRSGWASPAD